MPRHPAFVAMEHIDQKINRHDADLQGVLLHSGQATTLLVQRVEGDANIVRDTEAGPPQAQQDLRESADDDVRPRRPRSRV